MQDTNMLIETEVHKKDIMEKIMALERNNFTLRTRIPTNKNSKLPATLTLITMAHNIIPVKDKYHTG